MLEFLESFDFLSPSQYGFRKQLSTASAMFDFVHFIQSALDKSQFCSALFIDLTKAFDSVNHKILISLLNKARVEGAALNWFVSYLSDRRQRVKCNNVLSDEIKVEYGVPQGSVLGPILFLVVINSLGFLKTTGKLFMFADDLALLYSDVNIAGLEERIRLGSVAIFDHLKNLRLTPNVSKTKYMLFSKGSQNLPDLSLFFGDQFLSRVYSFKFLGIYLTSDLSWDMHIQTLVSKLKPVIVVLSRLKNTLPRSHLKKMYYSLIHSRMSYLAFIWGRTPYNTLRPLILLQNWAMRALFGFGVYHPVKDMYVSTGILPLTYYISFSSLLFFYKIVNGLLFIRTSLSLVNQVTNYSIRSGSNILPQLFSTKYGLTSVYYKSISEFNSLPIIIRLINSYQSFKNSVFEHVQRSLNSVR